ncbi:7 transmembrane receptor [Trichuris suis]|nr:7 transmembrane receptor [Trichuris suis]
MLLPASLCLWITASAITNVQCRAQVGDEPPPAVAVEFEIHRDIDSKEIKIDGDVMIGGLFPIHGDGSPEGRHCGAIKPDKGIQRLEAMLYAVDKINMDDQLLPTIKLGVHIMDTCHQDTHALERTLELIRSTFAMEYTKKYKCRTYDSPFDVAIPKPVVAVIGAASSQVSAMVSNVLRLFKTPQISYSSTSVELSDKSRFGYFSRVVPPDSFQAQAMADVVKQLGWNFVAVLADEGTYGEPAYEAFRLIASRQGICISIYEKIRRYYREEDFLKLIMALQKERSVGVVTFCHEDNIKKLMKAVVELKLTGRFAWIGSDNWGTKRAAVAQHPSASFGAITVQPKSGVNEDFNLYFTSLRPESNHRNVWFDEFWEKQFNCSLSSLACKAHSLQEHHVQEAYVSSVIDAVYLFAHSLHQLLLDNCYGVPFKQCNVSQHIDGKTLLKYIRTVKFNGTNNEEISLDSKGDRKARYNIYQFHDLHKYYVPVGEWTGRLFLSKTQIRKGFPQRIIPTSMCSDPCKKNEFKTIVTPGCCWTCLPCNTETSIMPNKTSCIPCKIGYLPDEYKSECVRMIPQYIKWNTWWALVPATFSTFGIVASLFVLYIFVQFNNTPLIKASGRELCYVMLAGIIACYCMTFPLLNAPSKVTCGILRIGIGVSACTIYAAIFTKTLRLARIFNAEAHQLRNLRFLSPIAQLIICSFIISIQVLTALIWIIVEKPEVVVLYPTRLTAVLSCKGAAVMFPISMMFNILLIILCTVYAFKTRKIPENFNETKYIGFTMYATCIVWLAFIPIYFGTNQNFKIQTTSLCICVSLCGTVALCCFFAPKMYIVIFQPEKNVVRVKKEHIRTMQAMRDHVWNLQSNLVSIRTCTIESQMERKKSTLEPPDGTTELSQLTVTEPDQSNYTPSSYRHSIISIKRDSLTMLLQSSCNVAVTSDEVSNEVDSGVENSRASLLLAKSNLQDYNTDNHETASVHLQPDQVNEFFKLLKEVTSKDGTIV